MSIHIKPSKRGTFTAAASKRGMSVQQFAGRVLANKDNYSSAMVKKANFARNASKWKKATGGLMEEPPLEEQNKVARDQGGFKDVGPLGTLVHEVNRYVVTDPLYGDQLPGMGLKQRWLTIPTDRKEREKQELFLRQNGFPTNFDGRKALLNSVLGQSVKDIQSARKSPGPGTEEYNAKFAPVSDPGTLPGHSIGDPYSMQQGGLIMNYRETKPRGITIGTGYGTKRRMMKDGGETRHPKSSYRPTKGDRASDSYRTDPKMMDYFKEQLAYAMANHANPMEYLSSKHFQTGVGQEGPGINVPSFLTPNTPGLKVPSPFMNKWKVDQGEDERGKYYSLSNPSTGIFQPLIHGTSFYDRVYQDEVPSFAPPARKGYGGRYGVRRRAPGGFLGKAGDFFGNEGAPFVGAGLSLLNTALNARNVMKTPTTYTPSLVNRNATPFKSQLEPAVRTMEGSFATASKAPNIAGVSNAVTGRANYSGLVEGVNQATMQDVQARGQYNLAQDQMDARAAEMNAQLMTQAKRDSVTNQIGRRSALAGVQQAGYQDLINLDAMGQKRDADLKATSLEIAGLDDPNMILRTLGPMLQEHFKKMGIEGEPTMDDVMDFFKRRGMYGVGRNRRKNNTSTI